MYKERFRTTISVTTKYVYACGKTFHFSTATFLKKKKGFDSLTKYTGVVH